MKTVLRYFSVAMVLLGAALSPQSLADQYFNDDVVIKGSLCVGIDCANGESFNYDTIRMKENNLRIHFIDTSSSSSFPTVDWQITINDSTNGGANYYMVEDMTLSTKPFRIDSGAPTDSLRVMTTGRIGMGTAAPGLDLEIKTGNSPGIRLNQDSTGGFTAQAWDVSGNETSFFVRDVSHNSQLPFRITAGATDSSIFIAADGDVGFETKTPDGMFDIAHPADANNHAVLVSPVGNFGINIDNGFVPADLLEVQTTGGKSRFIVKSTGSVGIGTATPAGMFEVKSLDGTTTYFNVDAEGDVGIGVASPTNKLHIKNGANDVLTLPSNGQMSVLGASASVNIFNNNSGNTDSTLLYLSNTGAPVATFNNSTTNKTWQLWLSDKLGDQTTTGSSMQFRKDSIARMSIDENGSLYVQTSVYANNVILTSDRNKKTDIRLVDADDILARLSNLDVATWRFKEDASQTVHMGPMAQDFQQQFGLGDDNTRIGVTDGIGVALASAKALNQKLLEKNGQIEQLKQQLEAIQEKLEQMQQQ